MALKEREITVREREQLRGIWASPLALAIVGATVAAPASIAVAVFNASAQRQAETERAEAARILQVLRRQTRRRLLLISSFC
jgi:hypothetical protein